MSVQALSWAFKQQIICDPVLRFVLICLADNADHEGYVFPDYPTLVNSTGLNEAVILKAITELIDLVLLTSHSNGMLFFIALKEPILY